MCSSDLDAYGRIAGCKDYKGLTGEVLLVDSSGNVFALCGWKNYALPSSYSLISGSYGDLQPVLAAGCYRTTFKCEESGDFYLYTGEWGRGEAWINGHSLGRYSAEGPQKTLYVPGCWLNADGENELVILDWVGLKSDKVECLKSAIL